QDAVKLIASQRRQDVGRFLQDMGDKWLENYRFLLSRDKAVRELIAELTGEPLPSGEALAAESEDAAYGADAVTSADDAEHDHDHHDHDGHHHH
ncbi:MAG TPA: hypothetical protein VKZ43_00115, partial [Trueperaceae bacterium]|nr:hypothetical protein [Trueperaceae bacterium]